MESINKKNMLIVSVALIFLVTILIVVFYLRNSQKNTAQSTINQNQAQNSVLSEDEKIKADLAQLEKLRSEQSVEAKVQMDPQKAQEQLKELDNLRQKNDTTPAVVTPEQTKDQLKQLDALRKK